MQCLNLTIFSLALVISVWSTQAQTLTFYQRIREIMLMVTGRSGTEEGIKTAAALNMLQDIIPDEVPFPCSVSPSSSSATSVHALRPSDVMVVGAIGDSLTAGAGVVAKNLLQILTDNRGLSWSIGGKDTWRRFTTLPNILREFNPKLIGASTEDSLDHHHSSAFNVATSGSMSQDLQVMAKNLIKRLKNNDKVDIKKHWKMITILIGNNDICSDVCYREDMKSAGKRHRKDLVISLRILRDNLPRTFVNLVPIPNLLQLTKSTHKPLTCATSHLGVCPCLFGPARAAQRPQMPGIIAEFQRIEKEVTLMKEFNDMEDFTVVLQPFTMEAEIPKRNGRTDLTYMSQDCFHLSQKGNAEAALSLWNNLLEPVGKKSTKWYKEPREIRCPSMEYPYFFTNMNSFNFNITI